MEKSSFFNAEIVGDNYDRVYLAEDYANYFNSFIGNGVFPNPSTGLQVIANDNMTVTLKPGKAWINGYMYENTDNYLLNVDIADGVLNRIDRLVLRLDFINREIKSYIKKGVFASSPTAPGITRDNDVYELAVADIYVAKGVTKITQANITDLRLNSELCGIVKGTIEEIDTTTLFNQYVAWQREQKIAYENDLEAWQEQKKVDYEAWTENEKVVFEAWFNSVRNSLTEDQAGNLYEMISEVESNLEAFKTQTNLELEKNKIIDTVTQDQYRWGVENGLVFLERVENNA